MYAFAAAVAALSVAFLTRVSFDANILRLLPQRTTSVRDFQQFLETFGSLDQLYIVFQSDDDIAEHEAFVDHYVQALRNVPEIASVDAQMTEPGKDWTYLFDRELYLLGSDGATAALQRFREPRLNEELLHTRELLAIPSTALKTLVRVDPLGLLTMLRNRIGRSNGFAVSDPTRTGYVSSDGRSRLLLVKPTGSPFDTDFCKKLFTKLVNVEAAARADTDIEQTRGVSVSMAGGYRDSVEAEQLIRHEGIINSVGSLVLLLLLVVVLFRTVRILLYAFVPLTLAALFTLGLNGVIHSSLSPAISGSAGMLFGLGIDGIVVLYLRYIEERQAGANVAAAIAGLSGTSVSVMLAQCTTAATFFALLLTDFPTLQDLGALVGIGILVCCVLTILLLPAMLPSRTEESVGRGPQAAWLGTFVTSNSSSILWVSAVATIALGLMATHLHLNPDIQRLQAQTSGSAVEKELAAQFGLPTDVLLVLNDGTDIDALVETDRRLGQALETQSPSVISSGLSLLLPPLQEQTAVGKMLSASGMSPSEAAHEIRTAQARVGFREHTFDPFLDRLPILLDPSQRISYSGLLAHGLGSVLTRFAVERDGSYHTVAYLRSERPFELATVGRIAHSVDPHLRLTGLPIINQDIRQQFPPQFLRGTVIGIAVVAALMWLVLRSLRYTLLTLLSTCLGFVWSAGLLAALHVELDLFSLFAVISFIGIAVDYGIYVSYRHIFEPQVGMRDLLTKTGAAIIVACATALVGFGSLVVSSYQPLHVMGLVSLITLTSCLAASVVLLPALIIEVEPWLLRRAR